ncbi:hypothetical protein, partial [Brevibacterium paucivorans]
MRSPAAEHTDIAHPGSLKRQTIRARIIALLAVFALLTPGLTALETWQAAPAAAEVTDEQLSKGGVLRTSETQPVAPGLDLTT